MYSLQHYGLILKASVKAAANILTLCEKSNLDPEFRKAETHNKEHRMLPYYIMLCFNKALFTRDRTNIYSLNELLENMTPSMVAYMKEYFRKQLPSLEAYSSKLAKKVKTIYGIA